jgi:hypothetical protein
VEALLKAVRNALEAGANFINIAFHRTVQADVIDLGAILPELKSVFDAAWTSSVGQPAYNVHLIGSVMSFFSASCGTLVSEAILDPEGFLPALMLTFRTPAGLLCTITTSVPKLPARTRARLLDCYHNAAADSKADSILIGGAWFDATFFVKHWFDAISKHQVAKLNLQLQLFTSAHMCLLAHSTHSTPLKCVQLDTHGPYSLMATCVEQPAPHAREVEPPPQRQAITFPGNLRQVITWMPPIPLYDNLIANLEPAVQSNGNANVEALSVEARQELLKIQRYRIRDQTTQMQALHRTHLLARTGKDEELHQKWLSGDLEREMLNCIAFESMLELLKLFDDEAVLQARRWGDTFSCSNTSPCSACKRAASVDTQVSTAFRGWHVLRNTPVRRSACTSAGSGTYETVT